MFYCIRQKIFIVAIMSDSEIVEYRSCAVGRGCSSYSSSVSRQPKYVRRKIQQRNEQEKTEVRGQKTTVASIKGIQQPASVSYPATVDVVKLKLWKKQFIGGCVLSSVCIT